MMNLDKFVSLSVDWLKELIDEVGLDGLEIEIDAADPDFILVGASFKGSGHNMLVERDEIGGETITVYYETPYGKVSNDQFKSFKPNEDMAVELSHRMFETLMYSIDEEIPR